MGTNAMAVVENNLWRRTAGEDAAWPVLDEQQQANIAIIGGGYTGLSAALHLAERGREVVLLEAGAIGEGAAGRNGGQVIPGLKQDPETVERIWGPGRGTRAVAFAGAAPDLVFELIARYRIACDAVRGGWLQPAAAPGHLPTLERRAAQWARLGASLRLLSRAEAAERLGTDAYHGALFDPRGGSLHPLKFARGLARAAAAAGARLFCRSPVRKIERTGDGWRLLTPRGELRCGVLVSCTNAYSEPPIPDVPRCILPLWSVQIASEPQPAAIRERIVKDGVCASDTRRLLTYFRLDAEGRFVIGGRGAFGERGRERAFAALRRRARALFPDLEPSWRFAWGGLVALTENRLPQLAEPEPGLLLAFGYNGRGVALATATGRLLADRLCGADADDLPLPPSRRPRPWPHLRLLRWPMLLATATAGGLERLLTARELRSEGSSTFR